MSPVLSGDNKRKHLEFIQGIITRMAGNLFYLKGWTITVIAALFALAAKDANPKYFYLAFGVASALWALDGYFLRHERLFRSLYDHVREIDEHDIDFSMSTEPFKGEARNKWFRCVLSVSLLLFYLSLFMIMLIVAQLLK